MTATEIISSGAEVKDFFPVSKESDIGMSFYFDTTSARFKIQRLKNKLFFSWHQINGKTLFSKPVFFFHKNKLGILYIISLKH